MEAGEAGAAVARVIVKSEGENTMFQANGIEASGVDRVERDMA